MRLRELRDQARNILREGEDPGVVKSQQKAAAINTFQAMAEEWLSISRGTQGGVQTHGQPGKEKSRASR